MEGRFSYSKIDTYSQCGFKYKLKYVDGHYFYSGSVATEIGTLIHATEEAIARSLKAGEKPDYAKLKNDLILKAVDIKHKYREDFRQPDKHGRTYADKLRTYLEKSVYRLEEFMAGHPELEIVGIEEAFSFKYNGTQFKGFIDRAFRDKVTGKVLVQDIKTYAAPVEKEKLATPLQFVIYEMAAEKLWGVKEDEVSCQYDLPFCGVAQDAGTAGFMDRGRKKLDKLLEGIGQKLFVPSPSPLCFYCPYSITNPEADVKALKEGNCFCPYHSLWTKKHKTFETLEQWEGLENHEQVLEDYILKTQGHLRLYLEDARHLEEKADD